MQATDERRLLSRDEVEATYGLSRRYLEDAARRGDGPRMIRIGRSIRYRPRDIEVWIEAHAVDNNRAG